MLADQLCQHLLTVPCQVLPLVVEPLELGQALGGAGLDLIL